MIDPQNISELCDRARDQVPGSLARLFERAYDELRGLASARLRGSSAHCPLETTALVHETFLRFANAETFSAKDRAHFFRYAGLVMRTVIVDSVRERRAQRRGCGATTVPLSPKLAEEIVHEDQILGVHRAMQDLANYDPRMVDVVQLRYFAGMTDGEIAHALGVTDRTVRRDWEKARLLLAEALES